jgi:hypothetical protein
MGIGGQIGVAVRLAQQDFLRPSLGWIRHLERNDLERNDLEQNDLEQNDLEQNDLEQNDLEQNDLERNARRNLERSANVRSGGRQDG